MRNEIAVNPATDMRLRVKPELVEQLLHMPKYRDMKYIDLIEAAEVRLGLARRGAIKGIRVTDRAMAIAILEAMPDNTHAGMVASV